MFTHFLLHILAGIRRGGREGEGGGEYEIITKTSNEAKNK
jgi:hypothetical protein